MKFFDMKVPPGVQFLRVFFKGPRSTETRLRIYKVTVLLLTFISYTCYHLARKAISVVKPKLVECPDDNTDHNDTIPHQNETCTSWITEINGLPEEEAKTLEGTLDTAFLFAYAISMLFFTGAIAERMNLRYYLTLGMVTSGLFSFLFGLAKSTGIKSIYYFIVIQALAGAVQATGWPGVVTAVANWFGKGKKGLIFGIWNSHTSIGNILGSVIAGVYVETNWGWSFMVPGLIIAFFGMVNWFFLVPNPQDVGIDKETVNGTTRRRRSSEFLIPDESTRLLQVEVLDDITDENEIEIEQNGTTGSQSGFEPEAGSIPTPGASGDAPPSPNGIARNPSVRVEQGEEKAISFWGALKIPGVVEFSLCLFFAKLVSYTFLYWLPTFIKESGINLTATTSGNLSTLFDVGGIVGGIVAGLATDITKKPASVCAIMLILAVPSLYGYHAFGHSCPLDGDDLSGHCYNGNISLLMLAGLLVNGPYALITTAVSAELGVHPSLQGSAKALATVTSIIDGTGSIGAAIGPFLAGWIGGMDNGLDKVFYMLIGADVVALVLLARLVYCDIQKMLLGRRRRQQDQMYNAHA